jgi:glycosyltransferase involved in cell wall biosynthesis
MYLQKLYEYVNNHSKHVNKFGEFRFAKITRRSRILKPIIGFYYIFKIPRNSIIIITNTEYFYFLLPKILFGFWKKHFYYMIICHLTSEEKKKFYRDYFEHIFIKKSEYQTTISDATLKSLIKNKLIDKEIEVIQPGIDYKPLDSLPVKDNKIFKILYVGSIEERKGLIFAINAMNIIKNMNFEFYIAGRILNKDYYTFLVHKINEYGLGSKIKFLGKVTDEELTKLYISSHLFLFLSTWEGYGMVLAEASSFGIPIIASKLPSFYTMLDDGYNGYYVDYYNKEIIAERISSLMNNVELRNNLSNNALSKARSFKDWDFICSIHLKNLKILREK